MRNREIKGNLSVCPFCDSDRIDPNGGIENFNFDTSELTVNMYCLDCGYSYESVFVFANRHVVEE